MENELHKVENSKIDVYQKHYTEKKFHKKIGYSIKKAGSAITEKALTLYYCMQDKETPKWAKSVILGSLGYFVLPVDAVPDLIPVLGLADDFWVFVAALGAVAIHVKQEHIDAAKKKVASIF